MRVGVDATCWQNNRGYGRHARALLSALVRVDTENQYTFFLDAVDGLEALPLSAEVRLVRAGVPTAVAASAAGHRSVRDMWQMSCAMADSSFSLLLFPTIYSYVPVFSRAKQVVMIHDVIAEKYPHLTLPSLTARLFWKAKVAVGRWRADALVTVSDYSRQCLLERFKMAPERVFVVGEASDPVFRRLDHPGPTPHLSTFGITGRERIVVYVGGFSPHKNLQALIAVFAKLAAQATCTDVRLIMVGEYAREVFHSYYGLLRQQVETLGITDRVIFTGYLSDEELVVLLNLATVLVLPSLMEGFGLPAVEAAACGCPTIATQASPLPGLLGDGGLYIDPTSQEDLESALMRVLHSEALRQRMRQAGLAAVGQLSWEVAAQQLRSLLHQVAV